MNTIALSSTKQRSESILKKIVNDATTHAQFLNTVSLLEHIGSRKILITQSNQNSSEFILSHAAEEARHALFFKKKIRLVTNKPMLGYKSEDLFSGFSSRFYFQKLDAIVKRNLKNTDIQKEKLSYINYLYTTILIELRAKEVYEIYDRILEEGNFNFRLTGIIAEEEGHLAEMQKSLTEEDLHFQTRLTQLIEKEEKFFHKLLLAWEKWIESSTIPLVIA